MKRNTFLKNLGLLLIGSSSLNFKTTPVVPKNKVIIFTPEILKKYNFGLYIINDKADVVKNPDYAATVAWKLGWTLEMCKNPPFKGGGGEVFTWPKYNKINFLTDGWICPLGTKYEEVCEYLNNNSEGEKFRIMTKEELFYIIEYKTNMAI